MKTIKQLTLAAGLVAMTALFLPVQAAAQRSGVEVWAVVCGRCHTIQPPARYSAKDWESILGHMAVNARLTGAQKEAILAFLRQGAMKVASAPQVGRGIPAAQPVSLIQPALFIQSLDQVKETFTGLCVPCHGTQGKGDGPAAIAFNPKPADFTNAELWKDRTDAALITSITGGVRMMPAFGDQLSQEQIEALVNYITGMRGGSAPQTAGIAP